LLQLPGLDGTLTVRFADTLSAHSTLEPDTDVVDDAMMLAGTDDTDHDQDQANQLIARLGSVGNMSDLGIGMGMGMGRSVGRGRGTSDDGSLDPLEAPQGHYDPAESLQSLLRSGSSNASTHSALGLLRDKQHPHVWSAIIPQERLGV
jgi:hypothetical protein